MLQVVGVGCRTQAWWGLSLGPFSESCFISVEEMKERKAGGEGMAATILFKG